MDVYGYHSYPYNQSDELAKQMFAQQALASSLPYNREVPEPHNMPAPSGAPWNAQGLPWGMPSPPQLVQFTGQPPTSLHPSIAALKRKSLDMDPVVPTKQLITEEKMAAHLNSLHISSNFTPHTLAADEQMELEPCQPISERLKGHRIVLSEEVKKLQEEPLLPPALIERLEKPRMSLVVWKPKEDILGKIQEDQSKDTTAPEEESEKKRNGVLVAEHPVMDVEM